MRCDLRTGYLRLGKVCIDRPMPWTAIALSRDVPPENTRAVKVDGREIVIWRGADGEAHVWEDRCPHRGMRLSFGFVRGTVLNCLYHGWRYGASGSCAGIPAHPDLTVPPTIKANAFPVRESGRDGVDAIRRGRRTSRLPCPAVPCRSRRRVCGWRGRCSRTHGSGTGCRGEGGHRRYRLLRAAPRRPWQDHGARCRRGRSQARPGIWSKSLRNAIEMEHAR